MEQIKTLFEWMGAVCVAVQSAEFAVQAFVRCRGWCALKPCEGQLRRLLAGCNHAALDGKHCTFDCFVFRGCEDLMQAG